MAEARKMVVQRENGESHIDPAGGLLWVLLDEIGNAPDNTYLLMFPLDDDSICLSVFRDFDDDENFIMELVNGPDGGRFRSPQALPFDQAHQAMLTWSFGQTDWRTLISWVPVQED